jgi:hypothetical protein
MNYREYPMKTTVFIVVIVSSPVISNSDGTMNAQLIFSKEKVLTSTDRHDVTNQERNESREEFIHEVDVGL